MNKLQQLLSELIDSSTVNDSHQSVIVAEDAIEMIEKAMEGMAIVPDEPKFPSFYLRIDVPIDYMAPAQNTEEQCQRDAEQRHLNSIAYRLTPQIKELIYKAMRGLSNG